MGFNKFSYVYCFSIDYKFSIWFHTIHKDFKNKKKASGQSCGAHPSRCAGACGVAGLILVSRSRDHRLSSGTQLIYELLTLCLGVNTPDAIFNIIIYIYKGYRGFKAVKKEGTNPLSAPGGIRTHTPFLAPAPKAGVATLTPQTLFHI